MKKFTQNLRFIRLAAIIMSLLVAQLSMASQNRVALVIGNGNYQNTPLANPVNDARLMASNLKNLGFQVILKTDATQQVMDDSIEQFGRQLEDGGVGLFFYAGHGIQSKGRNYLIPVNSRLNREKDLKYRAVDVGTVLDEMGNAANGLNIVVLDACRDNPLSRSFRSKSRGLTRIDDVPTGTLLAYSTALGKVAADGDGKNSPYTTALVEAMNQPGRPLLMVFQDVLKRVKKETRGKQTPWFNTSVEGDFYFRGEGENIPAPVQTPGAAPEMAGKHEMQFWNDVKADPSIEMYEAYLEIYPDGHYAAIAQIKLKQLRKASQRREQETQPSPFTIRSNTTHMPEQNDLQLAPSKARDETSKEEILSFVNQYINVASNNDIYRLLSLYADDVDYFGAGIVSKSFIRDDKKRYYKRWPQVEMSFIRLVDLINKGNGKYIVKYLVDFDVYSRSRGKGVKGISEKTIIVKSDRGDIRIISDKEKVHKREKYK